MKKNEVSLLLRFSLWCLLGLAFSDPVAAYRDYQQVVDRLVQLEAHDPAVAKIIDLGDAESPDLPTGSKRKIRAIKITKGDPSIEHTDRPDVLIIGGHHAREWISIEVALRLAEHLVLNRQVEDIRSYLKTLEPLRMSFHNRAHAAVDG